MTHQEFLNMVTPDGFFSGTDDNINWHTVDAEFNDFATQQLDSAAGLIFGRLTYELMASYWPTPEGTKDDPVVARGMNSAEKIVFSRTLKNAGWNNTRLVKDDLLAEVRRLKEGSGKDLTVLGSGSIVSQLAQEGLIDEFEILLNPVVLGRGKTMFEGVRDRFSLKLKSARTFKNGNVLLNYEPAR